MRVTTMIKVVTAAALVALAVPASASAAAKWLDYPTCTATATTITCTGRAAGIADPNHHPDPLDSKQKIPVRAFLNTRLFWTCTGNTAFLPHGASVEIQNGQTFTISLTPVFPGVGMRPFCLAPDVLPTRDSNYYQVSVDIGWDDFRNAPPPFSFPFRLLALEGPIGTVSPS